uniref:protein phosphatase 1 regulatory subunit 17 n=1 Tax=Pristiophorus japonicus TaxID=55135 RepID=UPI00398E415A
MIRREETRVGSTLNPHFGSAPCSITGRKHRQLQKAFIGRPGASEAKRKADLNKNIYITMTTECVWSPEAQDDRLDSSDQLCKHLDDLSNLSEQLIKTCEINEEGEKEKATDESKDTKLERKKPRRKDTPVQYVPPLIPGVKLMKEEKRAVFAEDDENDGEKLTT